MTDLDRLFDIHSRLCIEYTKELSDEYNALKAKIDGKIEKQDMLFNHRGVITKLESQVAKLKEELVNQDNRLRLYFTAHETMKRQLVQLKSTLDEITKLYEMSESNLPLHFKLDFKKLLPKREDKI